MILIIDSGGTKLDWRAIHSDESIQQGRAKGFHPLFQQLEDIVKIIFQIKEELGADPEAIHYYGTGFSSQGQVKLINEAFRSVFPSAIIEIQSDLLGVARAVCLSKEGIACILGTGSNSCFYNGSKIENNIPPLGYIVGDEGSGAAMGKKLIKAYMRNALPNEIVSSFEKRYDLNKHEIIEKIYKGENPNQFLAGFAKFLFHHQNSPDVYRIIQATFKEFVENVLLQYESINHYPIHFSGSIAFYFNGMLRQVVNDYQLTVGNIVETPIAGLTLFHQKNG